MSPQAHSCPPPHPRFSQNPGTGPPPHPQRPPLGAEWWRGKAFIAGRHWVVLVRCLGVTALATGEKTMGQLSIPESVILGGRRYIDKKTWIRQEVVIDGDCVLTTKSNGYGGQVSEWTFPIKCGNAEYKLTLWERQMAVLRQKWGPQFEQVGKKLFLSTEKVTNSKGAESLGWVVEPQ